LDKTYRADIFAATGNAVQAAAAVKSTMGLSAMGGPANGAWALVITGVLFFAV